MLRKIRIILATVMLIGITWLFVDFTGTAYHWFAWMPKLQFLEAVLALNVAVIIGLVVLTLQSYIDTLIGMSLVMGVVFELPVVCGLLGHMGLINSHMMSEYRRHAIVAILIVAAIITPTTDMFTLFVVALPIYLLYELSIQIVRITKRN